MDDRSYRDGCPPYCTCVDCATKLNKKVKGKKFFSMKIIYFIAAFCSILIIFFSI